MAKFEWNWNQDTHKLSVYHYGRLACIVGEVKSEAHALEVVKELEYEIEHEYLDNRI